MLEKTEINIENLNETYYRVVQLIGLDDTIRFSEAFAGQSICFKKRYNLDHDYPEIIACIGETKTKKLIKGFYGEGSVYFCKFRSALKIQVYSKIRKEFDGCNYIELSKKYGFTERNVRRIIAN